MIMELPAKKFRTTYAEVKKGKLLIYRNVRFEDLMYELTYATKKSVCCYCGKKLTKITRTIDHIYPRDSGGISIVNNLYPSCSDCNSKKSNLTHFEYLHSLKLEKREEKEYRKKILAKREEIFSTTGFYLPKRWVTMIPLLMIDYQPSGDDLRGKRYYRISEFYQKYKRLPRPIILDRNLKLLDGYNCILFAKDYNIRTVPVIILDNVILR